MKYWNKSKNPKNNSQYDNNQKDISQKENSQMDNSQKDSNPKNIKEQREINLDILDKTTIAELLTFTAEELFTLREQARVDFEKSRYRKQWIDGVIELKYKATVNDFYKIAKEYLESEPVKGMDKYNKDKTTFEIVDPDNIENRIEVKFYRGISEVSNTPKIKKKFRLIKKQQRWEVENV